MLQTTLKPKQCAMCPKEFLPRASFATVCSQRCAMRKLKADTVAKAKKQAELTRAQRERLKTRGELQGEAQDAFNAYIRFRDAGLPCIDCGKPMEPNRPGGSMDAGHFLPRSTDGSLRFHEDNVHGQRKNCNRPGGTTRAAFRAGLVARIGEERVRALETDNTIRKWTQDDFRAIRDTYRAKLKELKEKRE